jgi:sodium transport system permease protein
MTRFSRINTIWRKELVDTLRDRRTLVAMVLVPMVLYPALMLGSIQALEVQVSQLQTERYDVAVADQAQERWLRRLIDSDPARQEHPSDFSAEERVQAAEEPATQPSASQPALRTGGPNAARTGVRSRPPGYRIIVAANVEAAVRGGIVHCGVILNGPPPALDAAGSTRVTVAYNETDIRSEIAANGVAGILERAKQTMLDARLARLKLDPAFVHPLNLEERNVATEEQVAGSVLGKIVPLILIMMTITGAIYPAIDLTAGERERGTLETLMVAPVPTIELISGKFIVVTLIGLMSAFLNLLSIGGTVYLGGVGSALMPGAKLNIPLSALPLILLMLVPLAVMFSAMLLAVCSFARSFKEAQNYIVPVMMAALIPGVVGILPGTRLEGPLVIMPVANIVVLARELLSGRTGLGFEFVIVILSTSLYAGAAVAVAAKLFGQEAVLFADSGSVKTLFQRRFFKPRPTPNAATALLVLAITYTLNFYIQNSLHRAGFSSGLPFLNALAATLITLLVISPWLTTRYVRADTLQTFRLRLPGPEAFLAALCFGGSTWILAQKWLAIQQTFFKMDAETVELFQQISAWTEQVPLLPLVLFLAAIPAFCEELFFRGFALSGLRTSVPSFVAVLIVALAFGMFHYSAHRLIVTAGLGILFGLLVVRFGSIWPAILAHLMHNGLTVLASRADGLELRLTELGFVVDKDFGPPTAWVLGAAIATGIGVCICLFWPAASRRDHILQKLAIGPAGSTDPAR